MNHPQGRRTLARLLIETGFTDSGPGGDPAKAAEFLARRSVGVMIYNKLAAINPGLALKLLEEVENVRRRNQRNSNATGDKYAR